MHVSLVVLFYTAVAALVAAYTLYHGVILRPREDLFTLTHHTILTLTALLIGGTWPLFMPGLAIATSRQVARVTLRLGNLAMHRVEGLRARS